MGRFKLLLIVLLCSTGAFAQGLIGYMNNASDFFDKLNQRKFEEAQGFFADSLKTKVPPATLSAVWKQITARMGNLTSIDGAENRSQDDFQSVILNCSFEKGSQPFQFVFNKDQKLIGFFIAAKPNIPTYKLPAYADTASYKEEFITIKSGTHELPGILTKPKTGENFPVVILVHGSGPADMDESVGAQKPFKDLALGLASQGIASIRYVKRTTLYPQEFSKSFTLKEETIEDAEAALTFAKTLPEIDKTQLYIFGHSLGGMVAPRLATQNPDVKGIILAATPARKFTDIIIEQNKYLFEQSKDTTKATRASLDKALKDIQQVANLKAGVLPADSVMLGLPVSYWLDINNLNQVETAKKLKTKVLVIQGGNDFQVSTTDYNEWQKALKNKKNVSFKFYPMLNHLFSFVSEKGTASQYQQVANVDAVLINDVAAWIKQ
ncbi:alpha/beta hydrolase [Pedobacter glucosidilyticus]|uniref:alpha/beta hydrolase n=1 Tax=Pedobacter glucosidilyticus TaxID=1122941 RepID=UPI000411EAF7|nr:DUF3887 domain-containing protein [Pedobacter glucosidilyticus]